MWNGGEQKSIERPKERTRIRKFGSKNQPRVRSTKRLVKGGGKNPRGFKQEEFAEAGKSIENVEKCHQMVLCIQMQKKRTETN